jgi:TRADD-N domain-containing protein
MSAASTTTQNGHDDMPREHARRSHGAESRPGDRDTRRALLRSGRLVRHRNAETASAFQGAKGYIEHQLEARLKKCVVDQQRYTSRIEHSCDPSVILKHLLLKDLAQVDEYVSGMRLQARRSFNLVQRTSIAGFSLLLFAITLGIVFQMRGNSGTITVAFLTGSFGILTQFISGVMFVLYNRTLWGINEFAKRLEDSRKVCLTLFLTSLVHKDKQDDARLELIRALVAVLPNGDLKSAGVAAAGALGGSS